MLSTLNFCNPLPVEVDVLSIAKGRLEGQTVQVLFLNIQTSLLKVVHLLHISGFVDSQLLPTVIWFYFQNIITSGHRNCFVLFRSFRFNIWNDPRLWKARKDEWFVVFDYCHSILNITISCNDWSQRKV